MATKGGTLEEGLDRSANKRGFTGKERHRYIGGALYNMGKAKTRNGHSIGSGKPKAPKKVTYKQHSLMRGGHKPVKKTTLAHVPPQKPVDKHDKRPAIVITKSHQPLQLYAKKNTAESKPGHTIYSVYNRTTKTLHSGGKYTKMSSATQEARIAMDADRQRLKRLKMA